MSCCLTFYSDYFYQYRYSERYYCRGGHSGSGADCGAFYVYAGNVASATSWARGAALSFKPVCDSCSRRFIVIIFLKIEVVLIMLFAVVHRTLVLTVELSLLMQAMLHLTIHGIVVPPYHLNQMVEILIKKICGPQLRDPLSFLVLIIIILIKILDSIVSSRETTSFKILWSFKD